MKADDFNLKFAMKMRELVGRYGIKYTPERFMVDDAVADAVFHAGVDLLAEVGLYHLDTQRVIEFTREEILAIARERRQSPGRATFGSGEEEMTIAHRSGEDVRPPTLYAGIAGTIEEEEFIPLVQSFAQEDKIKGLGISGGIVRVGGVEPKAGTLSEVYCALWEQRQLEEVLRRVGRPGLNLGLLCTASTAGATIECLSAGFRTARNTQIGVHVIPEQKIDWDRLILTHFCLDRGIVPWQSAMSLIGGFCRDAADASVGLIANVLGHMSYANGPMCSLFPTEIDGTWASRPTIWAVCAAARASERNIRVAIGSAIVPTISWGRRRLGFYQEAVQGVAYTASGLSYAWLAGGAGVEACMIGEVMNATAGMKPEKAEHAAQTIMNQLEEELGRHEAPSDVLPFEQIYDRKTVKPKQGYLDAIHRAKEELVDLGMPYG